MGLETGLILAIGAGLASTAVSTYSSYQAGQAQKEQAEYQSAIANKNAELADDQARAQAKEGYDNAARKRLEVANIVSAQRARQAGSGAQVVVGSFLDLAMDTAERGEFDALNITQQGYDNAYNTRLQAMNYKNNASAYKGQANAINPWLNASSTALGGLAQVGSTYGSYLWGNNKTKPKTNFSSASGVITNKG